MPKPHLFLQIVDENGSVARLPAGGALEEELIHHFKTAIVEELAKVGVSHATQVNALADPILKKGVGFFKTQKKVEKAIRTGLLEVVSSTTAGLSVDQAIADAIEGAILALKTKTIYVI